MRAALLSLAAFLFLAPALASATPASPTNLQYHCAPDGKSVTLSWATSTAATSYMLRVNYQENDVPATTPFYYSCVDGWYCAAPLDLSSNATGLTSTAYTNTGIIPKQAYTWWVHSVANGSASTPTSGPAFSCSAPAGSKAATVDSLTSTRISGTALAVSVLEYQIFNASGAKIADATTSASSGTWSATLRSPLPSGTYLVKAIAGNGVAMVPARVFKVTVVVRSVADLDAGDPNTWLFKSVCVDSSNLVLARDPYGGCPTSTTIRKMNPTDPMPYNNIDQAGVQIHDTVPIPDLNGNIEALVNFDWQPFNQYNLYTGSDGYDVYRVKDGWVSGFMTQDGGAYSQVFFGPNCQIGNGWILFPAVNFLSGGSATVPIAGNFWEQAGQSFPGTCSSAMYDPYPVRTTWQFKKGFAFGGANGNLTKTMDTLVSYHGNIGHLEVFYFTREYGVTRWEAWQPTSQGYPAGGICTGPTSMTYDGVAFTRIDCRDSSRTVSPATASIPVWPLPDINLLQHAHFDDGGGYLPAGAELGLWHRGGISVEGNIINWSLFNSSARADTRHSSTGVRYLGTNCGGTCTGPNVQEIYQEIPIEKFTASSYAYGANVRTESGQGTMQITLQEISSDRTKVLWQDSFQSAVTSDNGPDQDPDQPRSPYLSSKFIFKTVHIPVLSDAGVIRYYFTPLTSNVSFDILDAWIAPWPEPTVGYSKTTAQAQGSFANLASALVAIQSLLGQIAGSLSGMLSQ